MPTEYFPKYKGKKLYKYYSFNPCPYKMFAPIINNTLKYTRPEEFNDPYDCYITMRNRNHKESIRKDEMINVHICSFTTRYNNILMWSYYATNHKGFVVEYDVGKLEEIKKINGLFDSQIEKFSAVKYTNDIICGLGEEKIIDAIFHKAKCWKHEHEVRSAYYGDSESNCKSKAKCLIVPEDAVSAIILGAQYVAEMKGKIPRFLESWKEKKKLHYMQLLSDKYKLERKKCFNEEWFSKEH